MGWEFVTQPSCPVSAVCSENRAEREVRTLPLGKGGGGGAGSLVPLGGPPPLDPEQPCPLRPDLSLDREGPSPRGRIHVARPFESRRGHKCRTTCAMARPVPTAITSASRARRSRSSRRLRPMAAADV